MDLEFTNLLLVVAAGFAAPLALGLVPSLRLSSVVVELVLGIVIGPAVLGWVAVDDPVRVLSLIGLAILLFLAGLEIEFDMLRGRTLRVTAAGFVLSCAIAVAVDRGLRRGDPSEPVVQPRGDGHRLTGPGDDAPAVAGPSSRRAGRAGAALSRPDHRPPGGRRRLGIANVTAALGFAILAPVEWAYVAPLALGLLAGGRLGPAVVRRADPILLRTLIGLSGLGLAVKLGIDAYG